MKDDLFLNFVNSDRKLVEKGVVLLWITLSNRGILHASFMPVKRQRVQMAKPFHFWPSMLAEVTDSAEENEEHGW